MSSRKIALLTLAAMIAFAGNSLLCRIALRSGHSDPATFTLVRLASGGLVLSLIALARREAAIPHGSWISALALFTYAAGFSFAYVSLGAAAGALLLFGAVQTTMIGYGLWRGERLAWPQWAGLLLACSGLALLLLPGVSAPPLSGAVLMLAAGAAWGVYSLRGRGSGSPIAGTAGNFLRAVPFALATLLAAAGTLSIDLDGAACAIASGALASGLGYAIWYRVLPSLAATTAASVQLSVPVITSVGAALFLEETVSLRLALASIAVLGGIALVISGRSRP